MTDIAGNICQATDILIKKQLQSLAFDITIEATIKDDTKAKQGRYTVSNGNALFEAFSSETEYKQGEIVLVTIPQANYDNQKTIIGKKADEETDNSPLVYKSPFSNIACLTTNLISDGAIRNYKEATEIQEDNDYYKLSDSQTKVEYILITVEDILKKENNEYIYSEEHQGFLQKDNSYIKLFTSISQEKSLKANEGNISGWNEDQDNFYDSFACKNDSNLIWDSEVNYKQLQEILTEEELNLQDDFPRTGFTRLGLRAQFSSWLEEYNTKQGNYGLVVGLTFLNKGSKETSQAFLIFDSEEFTGNVYDLKTYTTQETVFDISEFTDQIIQEIKLYAYQRNNFLDAEGNKIYDEDDEIINKILPNIFIKEPEVYLGVSTSDFEKDSARVFTTQEGDSYQKNFSYNIQELRSSLFEVTKKYQQDIFDAYVGPEDLKQQYNTDINKLYEKLYKDYSILDIKTIDNTEFCNRITNIINQYKDGEFPEASYNNQILEEISNACNTVKESDAESLRLKKNEKVLQLQWIHKDDTDGNISLVQEDQLPPGYHVWWYRYSLGAPAPDAFCGAHWERFYGSKNVLERQIINGQNTNLYKKQFSNFQEEYNIILTEEITQENYQIEYDRIQQSNFPNIEAKNAALMSLYKKFLNFSEGNTYSDEQISNAVLGLPTNEDVDQATDHVKDIYFYPNINRETEQLKAIILKDLSSDLTSEANYTLIATSNIITFRNNDEISAEIISVSEQALYIEYNDGSNGNYFVYGPDGRANSENSDSLHILNACFNLNKEASSEENEEIKTLLTYPYDYIKWSFPANNTMITPTTSPIEDEAQKIIIDPNSEDKPYEIDSSDISDYKKNGLYYDEENNYINIYYNRTEEDNQDESPYVQMGYYINDSLTYTGNNTVRLEIRKDGRKYYTSTTMNFGTAGTSGSDYTITLNWLNGAAFDVQRNKSSTNALIGEITLLDQNNQPVSLDNKESIYTYSWSQVSKDVLLDETEKAKTYVNTSNKYYPVQTNNLKILPNWIEEELDDLDGVNSIGDGQYDYHRIEGLDDEGKNNYKYKDKLNNEIVDAVINFNYLVPYINNDNVTYYYYDINTHEFKVTTNINQQILYRVLTDNEMKLHPKPCYSFEQVDITATTWSDTYRYFILDNGNYIIDPYDSFIDTIEYYKPILSPAKPYNNDLEYNCHLKIEQVAGKNNQFKIYGEEDINAWKLDKNNEPERHLDLLYIFQVRLQNFGDYDLIANFPLPLKSSGEETSVGNGKYKYLVDYIEGPTSIRYSTNGNLDYNKNPYKIHLKMLENGKYIDRSQGFNTKEAFGHWELTYDYDENITNVDLLPSLIESSGINEDDKEASDDEKAMELANQMRNQFLQDGYRQLCVITLMLEYVIDRDAIEENEHGKQVNALIKLIRKYNKQKGKELFYYSTFQYPADEMQEKYINHDSNTITRINKFSEKLLNNISLKKLQTLWDELYKGKYISKKPKKVKGCFIKPLLHPPSVYYSDIPLCGVRFVLDIDIKNKNDTTIATKGETLWIQPVYIFQDNYPSTTLNKWGGKSIETDNDSGIISAHGFSAGKKETDNTFTGVVLGDWSNTRSSYDITRQTGVYGFNHGAMSYALKDNGTAFFGKEGNGRIYFNGSNAKIYSANWKSSIFNPKTGLYKQKQEGLLLDVDDGIIKINGKEKRKSITLSPKGLTAACINTYTKKPINLLEIDLIDVKNDGKNHFQPKFYLRSADYHIHSSKKAGGGVEVDLSTGKVFAYNLHIEAGQVLQKKDKNKFDHFDLVINTKNKNNFLKINNGAISINHNGDIVCSKIKIKKVFAVKTKKIKISEKGNIVTKGNIKAKGKVDLSGNLIVHSKTDKNGVLKNNVRISNAGNITAKGNVIAQESLKGKYLRLYFNINNKASYYTVKVKKIGGHYVLIVK